MREKKRREGQAMMKWDSGTNNTAVGTIIKWGGGERERDSDADAQTGRQAARQTDR